MSISAEMMSSITTFRNANGRDWHTKIGTPRYIDTPKSLNIVLAEPGYIFTFAFSIVETVAKLALFLFSTLISPITTDPLKKAWKDLSSSAFSMGWSFVDIFINLFCLDIAASEAQARNIWYSGNICHLPSTNVI